MIEFVVPALMMLLSLQDDRRKFQLLHVCMQWPTISLYIILYLSDRAVFIFGMPPAPGPRSYSNCTFFWVYFKDYNCPSQKFRFFKIIILQIIRKCVENRWTFYESTYIALIPRCTCKYISMSVHVLIPWHS